MRRLLVFCLLPAVVPLIVLACSQRSTYTAGPNSDVLFADAFALGETGKWRTEADDAGATAVIDQQMIIEIGAADTIQYATLQEPVFSDFVLEVDATQLAGNLESSFGVLFRMQGAVEFYRFDITGDGRYMIERHNADGSWTRFVDDWREEAALLQGMNATNRLTVAAQGGQLTFYANGQRLAQFFDDSYSSGSIALDAGTFGQPGLRVAFDNLIVRRP